MLPRSRRRTSAPRSRRWRRRRAPGSRHRRHGTVVRRQPAVRTHAGDADLARSRRPGAVPETTVESGRGGVIGVMSDDPVSPDRPDDMDDADTADGENTDDASADGENARKRDRGRKPGQRSTFLDRAAARRFGAGNHTPPAPNRTTCPRQSPPTSEVVGGGGGRGGGGGHSGSQPRTYPRRCRGGRDAWPRRHLTGSPTPFGSPHVRNRANCWTSSTA